MLSEFSNGASRPLLLSLLASLLLAPAGWLALPLAASAQVLYIDEQFDFELTTGVVFTTKPIGNPAGDLDLRLELYQPSGPGVPDDRPALIAIHGGSFTGGNRFSGTMIGLCERMARRGWTCVSIDYRLQGDAPVVAPEYETLELVFSVVDPDRAATIAAATEDTVAAIEWLDANAATLGIDPTRIGLMGYSAGGALTEFVAYFTDDAGVTLPRQPRGTFNMSGAMDPVVAFVQPGNAAAFISHGDQDTVVNIAGAYALAEQLQTASVPYEFTVLAGLGHGYNIFTEEVAPGETVFDRFVPFFALHVASDPTLVPVLHPVGIVLLGLILIAGGVRGLRRRGYVLQRP